jgi:hypothetical protein
MVLRYVSFYILGLNLLILCLLYSLSMMLKNTFLMKINQIKRHIKKVYRKVNKIQKINLIR